MSIKNYSVSFPLELSEDQIGYKTIQKFEDVINFNIKSTIFTCPGERISEPEFGVCLRKLLFETPTPAVLSRMRAKIGEQLAEYMPYIKVLGIKTPLKEGGKYLNFSIKFKILSNQVVQVFETSVDLTKF